MLAWMVDQAVSYYGRWVEGMLAVREEVKNTRGQVIGYRRKYRLDVLLGIERKPDLPTAREVIAALGGGG